jgi:endonuclease/exonuclease/phosphatase family metal-dependent hydrolase
MLRKSCPFLALSVAFAGAADSPAPNPLDTIRAGTYSHSSSPRQNARLLNWNIDRGKHLDGILVTIRESKPDLCIFQEVDLGARRTQGMDIAEELAKTTGMNYAFAPEFEELSQSTQEGAAYHGQATLTTMPIHSSRILRFAHQSGFWKPKPLLSSALPIFQRREGGRIALVTELDNGGKLLVVYNLHLESRGSEHGRLLQLNEVLADAERYPPETPVIVAGDLNTKIRTSPVIPRLRQAGYRSAFGDRKVRTHIIIGDLDWIFARGPIQFEDPQVFPDAHASDHFAISVEAKF